MPKSKYIEFVEIEDGLVIIQDSKNESIKMPTGPAIKFIGENFYYSD